MFSFWLCAFDENGKGAKLAEEAKKLNEHMYGSGHFDWQGTLPYLRFVGRYSPSYKKDMYSLALGMMIPSMTESYPQRGSSQGISMETLVLMKTLCFLIVYKSATYHRKRGAH
jgi:hypothetical protein